MNRKLVYLLEDDPDISELIAYILTEAGYDVEESGTVRLFNDRLKNSLPDIFILDILLPDGNGLDICRQLRYDEKTAKLPVLVMSANKNKEEIDAIGCADGFIAKPFDIDYFRQRVDELPAPYL